MSIETVIAAKGVVLFLWLLLLFTAERLAPAARWPEGNGAVPGWRRLLRNGGLWAANAILSPLIFVPITFFAAGIGPEWRQQAHWLPSPGTQLLIDLVILDLFTYVWHRVNHTFPFLWRFHQVHHFDRFLDTTSATRFHAGEVLISVSARAIVVIALDIPFATVVVLEGFLLLLAFFNHANVRLPNGLERPLSWVIVTPSIHWVHHHAVRHDTDSNYGNVLSIWDRLFGTLSPNPRDLAMPIGLEHEPEDPSLSALMLAPIKPPTPNAVPGAHSSKK